MVGRALHENIAGAHEGFAVVGSERYFAFDDDAIMSVQKIRLLAQDPLVERLEVIAPGIRMGAVLRSGKGRDLMWERQGRARRFGLQLRAGGVFHGDEIPCRGLHGRTSREKTMILQDDEIALRGILDDFLRLPAIPDYAGKAR